MEMFNYVMVLASVIIGLGITHLLMGVAGIVQHPGRDKVYWVHLVWVGATFLRAIFWWWFEFRLSKITEWTFTLYVFVLAYAVILYLWCALLFPRDLVEPTNGDRLIGRPRLVAARHHHAHQTLLARAERLRPHAHRLGHRRRDATERFDLRREGARVDGAAPRNLGEHARDESIERVGDVVAQ